MKKIINISLLAVLLVRCADPTRKKDQPSIEPVSKAERKKPGSSFHNTVFIHEACAIFFYPDSLQREKIRAVTEPAVFEGSMHEFFYQQKTAHLFLKKNWPHLKIIEVSKGRFLFFVKENKTTQTIDLDSVGDSNGMIVFDPHKLPRQIDMTNIETEMPGYFNSH